MVKFATTLPQKTGVIASTTSHHHHLGTIQHNSQNQKHKKLGNLNLQPTTVHIQVQQGKNGQQQISLQPSDLAAMTTPTTTTGSNESQTGSNGVVHLQSPSYPHRTTATLLTQNIKLQQSPTNIQVYAQQLGRPGDSPKVIKASPSMQQVLLTSLAPTSPVGNRTTNSFSTINNASEPGKSVANGQKMNGTGATNTSTTNSSSVVASMKNTSSAAASGNTNRQKVVNNRDCHYSGYPKPAYSNACLIALALKNSRTGQLSVQEIYKFLCEHFPFFNTAPQGWKNSVRHALSMNKCFQKIPDPRPKSNSAENGNSVMASNQNAVKGFLWLLNPTKITRMEEELAKWTKKDTEGIKKGMRYPYKLEALIRGEVVKSYNVKPNRGSVDSEDMTSSEEEAEQDQTSQNYASAVLDPDLDEEDGHGKRGMMGVVRTNSILTEAATKNLLIHQQQNSPNNIPMPSGLATVLKKRLSPSNLNLGKRKRRSGLNEDEFCCLTCNFKSSNMDDLLKHFQNKQQSCNNKNMVANGNERSKPCSGSFTVNNANSTTNSKKIMNANNKFWSKITNKAENSEGDEDTESEEDEECQCPCCDIVVSCKEDFLKHFENYHNGESLDLDGAMKDSFNSEVMGVDGLLKGAANRLVNADGSLPYKIIEENMVPTNRGEYVKRMRQTQEPTFTTNAAANDSISNTLGSSYTNSRQNSIYSNISDLSRSTSINSSSSLTTNSGSSLPNHINSADDSFVSKIMGSLEDDLMVGNCHDLEQRSRRLSQESSSCESLTSNDFLTDSDDINDHLNNGLSAFTSSSSSGLRAIGVETLLSGGSSTLMDKDYDEWIEEEWDLSQFLIAPPQPELDMINGFSSELQF